MGKVIKPLENSTLTKDLDTVKPGKVIDGREEAADLVRKKIAKLQDHEPAAEAELIEAKRPGKHSKHQQYLLDLHASGDTMEDIQVKWHEYYQGLSKDDKFDVWKEFYDHKSTTKAQTAGVFKSEAVSPHSPSTVIAKSTKGESETPAKLGIMHHLKSIGFGLMAGVLFLSVYMFTFFNERFIIPFVTPSTISASSQIITVPNAQVSEEPRIIIPKLNVEAPVVYGVQFIQPGETEADFEERTQEALETGVVHYPTSQLPGEAGNGFNSNTVIVGHSANNIFNRGDFKFAFMQLRQLEVGDVFYINFQGQQYVYKIYEQKIVKPTEVSVLGAASRPNSATLITCDPPGRNVDRLVTIAEQISPNPTTNVTVTPPTATPENTDAGIVPGQPESLWSRISGAIF